MYNIDICGKDQGSSEPCNHCVKVQLYFLSEFKLAL